MTDVEGLYLNYSGKTDKGKEITGAIWIPKLYYGIMRSSTDGNSLLKMISEFTPFLYKNRLGEKLTYEINPLTLDLSGPIPIQPTRATSSVGMIYDFDGKNRSKAYVNAEIRPVFADDAAYNVKKMGIASRFTGGFRMEDSSIELKYKPQSIVNKLDAEIAHGFSVGHFNVLFSLEAKMFQGEWADKRSLIDAANLGVVITFVK